ncbi:MAG: hypothetical protein U9R79_12285 [Armatimonadota bacterium]|nr:hypothetical protein [Armatimonadota bacterium]
MRTTALLAACLGLAAALVATCARAQLSPELRKLGDELDALAAENQLIEDLNTLQLTTEQIQSLIPATSEVQGAAIALEQQRLNILRRLKPLLQRKRELLIRDEHPPEELPAHIEALDTELAELDRRADESLTAHASVFREILSDAQIAIVTGEEEARRQVVELIEWVRELDDEAFESQVPAYVASQLTGREGDLSEDEILELLSLARAMDAEQYRREGEALRGKLMELFRPSHEEADRMIVNLFLHEAMPTVLQDKLQAAQAQ